MHRMKGSSLREGRRHPSRWFCAHKWKPSTLSAERFCLLMTRTGFRLIWCIPRLTGFGTVTRRSFTFRELQSWRLPLKIILNCACGLLLNIYNTVWSSWWIFEFTIHTLSNLQWKPATNETRQETPAIGCKTHDSSEMLSDGSRRLV